MDGMDGMEWIWNEWNGMDMEWMERDGMGLLQLVVGGALNDMRANRVWVHACICPECVSPRSTRADHAAEPQVRRGGHQALEGAAGGWRLAVAAAIGSWNLELSTPRHPGPAWLPGWPEGPLVSALNQQSTPSSQSSIEPLESPTPLQSRIHRHPSSRLRRWASWPAPRHRRWQPSPCGCCAAACPRASTRAA
jgi:hypothetical protein